MRSLAEKWIKLLSEEKDDITIPESGYDFIITKSTESWFGFFATLAFEAFKYEAKTGSLKAIEWSLKWLEYLPRLVDKRERYEIMVDVGFTFYNFTRDARFRYGITNEEKNRFFDIHVEFKKLVLAFTLSSELNENRKECLHAFVGLIYVGFATSVCSDREYSRNNALEICEIALQPSESDVVGMPDILTGLYAYHAAKLYYLKRHVSVAASYFCIALDNLLTYARSESSLASYYYDVISGK